MQPLKSVNILEQASAHRLFLILEISQTYVFYTYEKNKNITDVKVKCDFDYEICSVKVMSFRVSGSLNVSDSYSFTVSTDLKLLLDNFPAIDFSSISSRWSRNTTFLLKSRSDTQFC